MKKIINSAEREYTPVETQNLVLDDTPTEGSFNCVTSDGVAKAIAEGGGGTEYTAGDGISIADGEISAKVDGTTIQVNADGELEAIGGGGGGGSYTAGDGININNDEISVALGQNSGLEVKQGGLGSVTLGSTDAWRELDQYVEDPSGTTGRMCTDTDYIELSASAAQENCKLRFAIGMYDQDWGDQIRYLGTQNLTDFNGDEAICSGTSGQTFQGLQDTATAISQDTAWTAVDPDAYWGGSDCVCIVAVDSNGDVVGSPLAIVGDTQFFYTNSSFATGLQVVNKMPNPGSDGQVLKMVSGNPAWADLQGGMELIARMPAAPNSAYIQVLMGKIASALSSGKIPYLITDDDVYLRYWTFVGTKSNQSTYLQYEFQIPSELIWNTSTSSNDLYTETLVFNDDFNGGYTMEVKRYVLATSVQGQTFIPFPVP